MKITKMSKADFAAVPELNLRTDWERLATTTGKLLFHSFVIIPVERDGVIDLHDSGWGCMEFVLVNDDMEPIGKVGGGCDVVNLDGIGGYGYNWREHPDDYNTCHVPGLIPVHGWAIDCLPCGYLRVLTKRNLFLSDRFICSNFEPYSEDYLGQMED